MTVGKQIGSAGKQILDTDQNGSERTDTARELRIQSL
jgi:hypothetical protein